MIVVTNSFSVAVHRANVAEPADSCSVDHLCSAAHLFLWGQSPYIHHRTDDTLLRGFDAGRYQLVPVLTAASASIGIVAPACAVNFAATAVADPAPHYVVVVLGAAAPAVAVLVAGAPAVAVHAGATALLLVPSFEHVYPQFFIRLGVLEIIVLVDVRVQFSLHLINQHALKVYGNVEA